MRDQLKLSRDVQEILIRSCEAYVSEEKRGSLRNILCARADNLKHEDRQKLLQHATAYTIIASLEDPEARALVTSDKFVRLRPLNAGVHRAFEYIVREKYTMTPEKWQMFWHMGARLVLDVGNRLATRPIDELLSVHTGILFMQVSALACGKDFAPLWRDFWRTAERFSILENRHIRMQLSWMDGGTRWRRECSNGMDSATGCASFGSYGFTLFGCRRFLQ